MPRGGARKNTGPKRKLGLMEKVRVGGRCERLWREARQKNMEAAIEARDKRLWLQAVRDAKATGLSDEEIPKARPLHVEWAKARAVPISERHSFDHESHAENVDYALREEQRTDEDSDPNRIATIKSKRPKGLKKQIIVEVATLESFERGIEITPRMVKTCWDTFRKVEQDLSD